MRRNNLSKETLRLSLHVSEPTLRGYIKDPLMMSIKQLVVLAGLFQLPVELLTYSIVRNRPTLKKEDKWYIEDMKQKQGFGTPDNLDAYLMYLR